LCGVTSDWDAHISDAGMEFQPQRNLRCSARWRHPGSDAPATHVGHTTGSSSDQDRPEIWLSDYRALTGPPGHSFRQKQCAAKFMILLMIVGAPEEIRTPDPQIRSCVHPRSESLSRRARESRCREQFTPRLPARCFHDASTARLWDDNASNKEPLKAGRFQGLNLVAGVGFEPTTFRL
jgi:hypothetical protein